MKSIFVKILLLFSVTLVFCLSGMWLTNWMRFRFAPGHRDFFSESLSLQVTEARHAYESGGKEALRQYIERLHIMFPGRHTLVDSKGIDVLTGIDRSADLRKAVTHWNPGEKRQLLAWPSRDGKYQLVIDSMPLPGPWSSVPYYAWIAAAALIYSYVLTVLFASPLRLLEQAVHRFGAGDLAARADTNRQDEFGKLARSFNVMADRIQTLLTAERRLLQDVSHELRSPLARLEFAVELARTSEDRGAALNRIKKEVDRLGTLVSELLQVTRAENDPESRNFSTIQVPQLLQELIDDGAMEAAARGVQLLFTPHEELELSGDRELLRRAVENVLRNAIRYAPERSVVDVSLRSQAGHAIIAIRDYGPGVAEASLPSLFKPFFRVEEDRNRDSGGGVGLGLSIAQRAVALHQGEIAARNAHPGLQVEIELPGVSTPAAALKS